MRRCWRRRREMLQQLTGMPDRRDPADVVAARPARGRRRVRRPQHGRAARSRATIAVVAYPRISNLDEFQPLKNVPGVRLRWARSPADVARRRLDHPARLQAHQRRPGLAARAGPGPRDRAACGARRRGARHLRRAADAGRGADRHRMASTATRPGLGLLPLVTVFEPDKTVQRTRGALRHADGRLGGAVGRGGARLRDPPRPDRAASRHAPPARAVMPDGLAWQNAAGQRAGRLPARPVRGPGRRCMRCSARWRRRWTTCSTAWPISSTAISLPLSSRT